MINNDLKIIFHDPMVEQCDKYVEPVKEKVHLFAIVTLISTSNQF